MILQNTNGVPHYQFKGLSKFSELRHAVFTRKRDTGHGKFKSFNIGHGVGDDESVVEVNREMMVSVAGGGRPVFVRQVHGADVLVIDKDFGTGQKVSTPLVGDAMVTDVPGNLLVIQVADCQPVLMYDPEKKVVAGIHSGWRGSVQNIIGHTVSLMQKKYGTLSKHIHAGIGPSLGPCCAEFINYKTEIPESLWSYRNGDNHFDFWSVSRDQLLYSGLLREHIEIGGICTRCRTDLFFSYRGEKMTGRFAGVIGLMGNRGPGPGN